MSEIKEMRFVKKPNVLTVLVLLAVSESVSMWHTQDFVEVDELTVLEGIDDGTFLPEGWEQCGVEGDFFVGADPRTTEQKTADQERQTDEMRVNLNAVFEIVKPHLAELINSQTREKYIAAALTGLLANERLTKLGADEIAELAIGYTDAVLLVTQETTEA